MRKLLILLFILSVFNLFSAEFVVRDFKEQPMDIELQKNPVQDVNNEWAALIKISTDLIPFTFQTNIEVVQTEKKIGEFWAYIPAGASQLIFSKEGFSKLRYTLPITIKSNTVYTMSLGSRGYGMDIADENLVQITFNLNENKVYIAVDNTAPIEKKERIAVFKIPRGEHTFKFSKQEFDDITRTVDAQNDEIIPINLEQGQTTQRLKLPGYIDVSSEPDEAEIFINDQRMGVTPIFIELTAGEHKLTLRKTLYHTYTGEFELIEGENKTLPTFTLQPKFGYYEVNTTPEGANVFLDNKLIGKTPISHIEIESGTHELRAEYGLYHTEIQPLIIEDGDDKEINILLKPAFGELVINSQPEQVATVYIDGVQVGTTPYQDLQTPSGLYRVRIDKYLWMGSEELITVYDEQTTEKTLLLTRNFATLTVNASGANIFLNDEYVALDYYSEKLEKGNYIVRAEKDGHDPDEKEVYISSGNDRTLELKPVPMLGSLSVKSNPYESKDAEIWLNNLKQKETTPAVLELLIGNYDVTLKHSKFLDQTKSITIEKNKQKSLEFNMQTYEGSMLSQADKWKKSKWISLVSALLLAGGGVYCNSVGDGYLDDYEKSTTTADAVSNRDNFERWYNYRDYSYYISIGPVIWGIYSWAKESYNNKQAQLGK